MRLQQSLQLFFESSFAPLYLRSRSERTIALYANTLRNFTRFLQRPPVISDLTDETVSRFLSWFRALPRSPYTVNKERDNLLCLWRYAARKRIVKDYPDVKPDKEPLRIPQAWTHEELRRLFAACKAQTGWIDGVPANLWWLALHQLAWCSGERITAVMAVRWEHVDLASAWLIVPAENRKGGLEDRGYRLSPDAIHALKMIEFPKREMVFPWPYSRTYLWSRYKPILKAAELPSDRKSMFHRLRKSVASHYEAAGGDAMKLLGHSKRSVTGAYLDPKIVSQPQPMDKLFRIDIV